MNKSDHDRLKELEAKIEILETENRVLREKNQGQDPSIQDRDFLMRVANASHVAITVLNRDGEIMFVNERAEEILGLRKNEIGQRLYNAPEWRITDFAGNPFPDEQLPFHMVLTTQKPAYDIRHAIEWPDGRRVFLSINAIPLMDDNGDFLGMVNTLEDITQQIRTEAQYRELKILNEDIVQNISEGIAVQDTQGNFIFWNPAGAAMLGYKPDELTGRHWTEIIPSDQHLPVQEADQRRLQGKSDRYEIELMGKSGARIPVLVSGSPRVDPERGEYLGTLAVITDITERKQAEYISNLQRDLATALNATIGLDNVLNICLETALQETGLEAGGIYLIDRVTGDLSLALHRGLSQEFVEINTRLSVDTPNAYLIMAGNPVFITYKDLNLPTDDFRIQEGLKVAGLLPIQHKGQIIAAMNVASRLWEEIPSNSREILEAIAIQAGGVIARARSEELLKQRVDQLLLINEISGDIAAILDLQTVLDHTAQSIQESFGYQHVGLFTFDRIEQTAVLRAISGDFVNLFPKTHKLNIGQGLVGWVVENNQTALVNNVDHDSRYINLFPDSIRTRAELSVPIQIGGEVAGVIDVQSMWVHTFDESDVLVIETLADQVAVAIHNARLHEALHRELEERQMIETALRESEAKFRNIVESSPMGMHMYQLEPDNRLVFVGSNPAADTILGVNNQKFIGQTIEQAFPALSESEIPQRYRQAAAEGLTWKADQIVYEENNIAGAFTVYAFQTSPNRMTTMFLDVTERKQIEKALEESEEKFRVFFRSINDAVFVHPLLEEGFGNFIEVNDTACRRYGYSKEEFYGLTAMDITKPQDAQKHASASHRKSLKEQGSLIFETEHSDKWGNHFPVEINSSILELRDQPLIMAVVRDITERKQAEKALRESENKYRRLIETANDAIFVAEVETGTIIDANQRAEQLIGRPIHEIIGMHQTELHPPERIEDYQAILTGQIRNGSLHPENFYVRHKDGHNIPVDISASLTEIEGKRYLQGIFRDITERVRTENALHENERFLESVFGAIQDGISVLDKELNIIRTNQWMEKMYSQQMPLVGKKCYQVYQQKPQVCSFCPSIPALKTGKTHSKIVPFPSSETPEGWLELSAFPLRNTLGEIVGVIEYVKNITDRILAENALRENQALLESIFRVAPTGIGLVSERILLQVNAKILEMTGRTREELVGKNARILYPTDEDYEYVGREKYRQIQEFGTGTVETRWQKKDGEIIDVLMSSTPLDPYDLTAGVTFTALDITERKSAEQQIQTQLERLAALRHIDTTITTSQELAFTLNIILEQAINLLKVDSAVVSLLDPYTQFFEFTAGRGFNINSMRSKRRQLGKGLAGRAALERQPIIIPNLRTERQLFSLEMDAETQPFAAYCGVPLIAKGQVKGILEIFSRDPIEPTPDWVDFLTSLAGEAAITIDNAELFNNLQRSNLELKLAYNSTLEGWSRALELRDFETKGHTNRVTQMILKLARAAGIPEDELDHVYRGALLHDIGKMGIPDSILLKAGQLNAAEWEIMKQHPVYAYEMLLPIEFLRPALDIPYCHHEKWDGSGYPRGLVGEAIPLAARVFAIIDVWDALSSPRPYRGSWTKEAILEHIREQSGKYFDPHIVEIFLAMLEDV